MGEHLCRATEKKREQRGETVGMWIEPALFESSFLTLILLTWRIWRAPNNASRGKMGFNSAFEGLNQNK